MKIVELVASVNQQKFLGSKTS